MKRFRLSAHLNLDAGSAAADVAVCTVLAGEGVGLVSEIEGAEEIVLRVEAEAVSAVQGMQAILQVPSVAEVGSM
jgi:hypothetical protein